MIKDLLINKFKNGSVHKYLIFLLSLIIILFGYKFYFYVNGQASLKIKAVNIKVHKVEKLDFPIYIWALGTIIPEKTVNVQSQITGIIKEVLFNDGQKVKAGQIIAKIDDASFRAQLEQYQGQLKRDSALLDNAKIDLKRYQNLWQQNSISQQTLDTQVSLVKQYEGTVIYDQGLVDATKVNLNYCIITSPIDGKIGLNLINEGNQVQSNGSSIIAIINSIDPIIAQFSISEDDLTSLYEDMVSINNIKLLAYNSKKEKLLAEGDLIAIDNQIDTSTGTIKLQGKFQNKDERLFANQFVNIKMLVKKLKEAIVIPSSAVQHSENGDFVYLVDNENKIKLIKIKIIANDDKKSAVIADLKEDQLVLIEGSDKISEGTLVTYNN